MDGDGDAVEVWCEGYQDNGGSGRAHLIGTVAGAKDFDEAVASLIDAGAFGEHTLPFQWDGSWRWWGCYLYDNEADARKSFG